MAGERTFAPRQDRAAWLFDVAAGACRELSIPRLSGVLRIIEYSSPRMQLV